MTPVTGLRLRGILDSRAHPTVEADMWLGEVGGRGSCPVAIAPGRLERRRALHTGELGDMRGTQAARLVEEALIGYSPTGQADLDERLRELDDRHGLGADVTLALSLAYGRAAAAHVGLPFHAWLTHLYGEPPRLPRLLVNAFSGGIHRTGEPDTFQQIMAIPDTGDLIGDTWAALDIYAQLERLLAGEPDSPRISASSGFLVAGRDSSWQLETLRRACGAHSATLGADVAAEHLLAGPGRYRYQGREHDSAAFGELLLDLASAHVIEYLEDPFDPGDVPAWEAFLPKAREAGVIVVGDDLFASDAGLVRPGLADAVLLKPSQAGTITGTLDTARAARELNLLLVVSHRSGETEDTAMCDLAMAVGAEWIKIGGPRRGDRIAKYNQLIRLNESLTEGAPCPSPSASRS